MKIAALVSGGVDSSVALHLLKQQGHDLTAFYLKIWLEDELSFLGDCPWEQDLTYVRAVCEQLDVPLRVISLQKEYHDQVVSYTVNEVKQGRTPNPDILCNQRIKFGMFWSKVGQEFDKVATGHYAQVIERDGNAHLYCAPDEIKDQTYFLSHLSQEQLRKALFPIGHLTKAQVRELAERYDLLNKHRRDSQGICFLGKLKFRDFIAHYLGTQRGDLIEYETGIKQGEHDGFWFYTIGQRQGIGLAGGPWYVVAKSSSKNIIYISKNYYAPEKDRDTFFMDGCKWIAGEPPKKKALEIKIRHGKHAYACTINFLPEGRVKVQLNARDQGIAPGQFAVLYDNNECLGGGIITDSPATIT
jgi:tRNA-specific 2-thiouridylase